METIVVTMENFGGNTGKKKYNHGKAYAATCICYIKRTKKNIKSIRGNLYLLHKTYKKNIKSIRGNLYLLHKTYKKKHKKHTRQLVFAT